MCAMLLGLVPTYYMMRYIAHKFQMVDYFFYYSWQAVVAYFAVYFIVDVFARMYWPSLYRSNVKIPFFGSVRKWK